MHHMLLICYLPSVIWLVCLYVFHTLVSPVSAMPSFPVIIDRPMDTTIPHRHDASCLPLVLPFWYWLTQVVPEKRPLDGCSVVVVVIINKQQL